MNFLEKTIATLSPKWAANRSRNRYVLNAYEAAQPSRTHKASRESKGANSTVRQSAVSLREQARALDQNHDIVIGILDKLEERVIGSKGIHIEPQPLNLAGDVHEEFAEQIRKLWAEWSVKLDVTGLYTRPLLERMLLRTWLRDGEVFVQLVKGKVAGLEHSSSVAFSLEALEPDFVPMQTDEAKNGLVQGVFLNAWRKPTAYQVYLDNPQESNGMYGKVKTVSAENMLHLAFRKRLHQIRGVSMLHGVIVRLADLKEYEESERVAARIAAAMTMYIKKGDAALYDDDSNSDGERLFDIAPGAVIDDLKPGEDIGLINSNRPNVNLETFRNGQLRATAAGTRSSYSSIARDYNGTYSAQRQELVESFEGYAVLQDAFVAAISRPIYREWLKMAIASQAIKIPSDIDERSLFNAVYSGPVMPWIDPIKEANAWKERIKGGLATEGQAIRASGNNPAEVKRQRIVEIKENAREGLKFDTDLTNTQGLKNETNAILSPVAMAVQATKTNNQSWFTIKAAANDTAEISIYDEIGFWGVTAQQFAKDLKALGNNLKQINLHIHSPGGDVFDGIAIYNLLKNHPANKTVYIDGLAASMASVIAMAGNEIIMPENAMMIHKPWGIQGGDAEDMRKYADLLDKVESTLITAYSSKTGKSADELAAMLSEETWLTGKECVELGFADKLADPLVAMASIQSKKLEDYTKMPNEIKAMLFTPQGNTGANPNPEQPQTPPQAVENPQNSANALNAGANALTALSQRNTAIKATFAAFGSQYDGLLAECLADVAMTAEQAKDKLLAKLGENTTPSVPQNHIYVGNGNIVGDSLKASLLHRTGQAAAEKDNAYAGMTLREMARASLTERGVGVSGMNAMQIVGLAFTHSSSDFGSILLDVAHKSIIKGWEEHIEDFDKFTTKGVLTDFRPAHRVGMGEFDQLDLLPEGAEYTYATLADQHTQITLATYGKAFSITRQAIINDDLGMLTKIPYKLGKAAKATIANLIFATLTGKKDLFSKANGNLLENGEFGLTNLDKAIQMMNAHKSFDGKTQLLIEPDYLLVPTALYTRAKQIIGSSSVEGAETNSGIINPLQNIVPIAKSQRLQAVSPSDWYLINREAIEVSYLDGVETPFIDQMEGFDIDGIKTKVRIDAGVNVIDHRGLLKAKA